MFSHFLVPLDGSRTAELVLPAVSFLAEKCGASITVLHVIERNAPRRIHGERHLTEPAEAQKYLREVTEKLLPAGMRPKLHVHETEEGHVARSIEEHGCEFGVDLIVMCTHGRRRLGQVLFGTNAQRVIALGRTPVLFFHPAAVRAPASSWKSILVPLDGNPEHEDSLPMAAELARRCDAIVRLLVSVPTVGTLSGPSVQYGRLSPGATSELLEIAEYEAEEYLRRQVKRMEAEGPAVMAEVCRGDAIGEIAGAARRWGADLIVMATHGKVGSEAFWCGSVTPAIFNRARVPLLLVPVQETR
jgi:nucleotide-binding universal stress UspA family protein